MILFGTLQSVGDAMATLKKDHAGQPYHFIPEQLIDGNYIIGCYIKVVPRDTTVHKDFELKFAEWV